MASTQHVHQTLHPLARSRLDQRFIKHFDEVVQFVPAIEQSSEWHEGLRWAPSGYEGMASDAVVVKTTDIKRGNYEVRIYGPTHDEQGKLYPAFVYFHGGGGVVGGIESDAPLCSRVAVGARARVFAVAYRLAPEHPHPAGFNDCFDAVCWVAESYKHLEIDPTRIMIGGSSTGANFAAGVALKAKARNPPIQLKMQILLVPPTIHTAGRHGYRQRTPWAPGAARIEWYDSLLYPNGAGTESPEASPLLASLDQLKGVTNAWIGIAEEDALREEGFAFAEKLQEAGVKVSWIEYQKVPHMLLQLDKQLEIPVIEDIVGVVKSCIDA